MTEHATGFVTISSWDEKTWDGRPHQEVTGRKQTRATVTTEHSGDVRGTSTVEYLMSYGDLTCQFIAMEKVDGELGGRTGSFLLRHVGRFQDGVVSGTFEVVPESGTGELAGLTGSGDYRWNAEGGEEKGEYTLAYRFE